MTYGVAVDVAAPAEMDDALQHEVVRSGPPPETRTEQFEVRGPVLPAAQLVR